jgi:hypothetical protein
MQAANVDLGKVVLFQPTADQLSAATRRAERHSLAVDTTDSVDDVTKLLGGPNRGVLVLSNYTSNSRSAARTIRALKGWKRLPVFAVIPDDQIDARTLRQANLQQIELLPTSMPENRVWLKLRDASDTCRSGKRWQVNNRRAHFRLPLTVKAALLGECETIDISEGGVAFLTNQVYHPGDQGRIDIRSLLGDMDADQRGFAFEVVSVKSVKGGVYRYCVGARFIELSEDAKNRLKDAIEVIEPTSEE